MIGGLGSGKTKLLAILATMLSYENPPGVPGMVVAPTYPMLRDTDAVALEEFWHEHGIPFVAKRADNNYLLPECGNQVYLRSCDNPDRLRGPNLGWILGDEIAQWDDPEEQPQRSAVNVVIGRIRHPKAKRRLFAVVGTPNGFDHLHARFMDRGGKRFLPDAWYTHAPTTENTFLSPAYVASLKGAYTKELYEQEVEGRVININTLSTYSKFDPGKHLRSIPIERNLPLILCCDFNLSGAWVVAQCDTDGVVRAVDEIQFDGKDSTNTACKEFLARYANHPAGWLVYADRSGSAGKTTTTLTDFDAIREHLKVEPYARHGSNPRVVERVDTFNAMLENAHGDVRLYIDGEKCPRLVRDMEKCRNLPNSRQPDKSDVTLTHASDAVGYYLWMEHRSTARERRAA